MTDTETIEELENERYVAMENGDLEGIRALCHPDLIYTHSNGERDTVASWLAKVAEKFYDYGTIEHPIDRILLNDGTAVVVGVMRCEVKVQGEPRRLNNSSIAVWTRTDAGWKLLAYQPTPLPSA